MLDGVNLTIRRGEIMGLVGESGCGKTTLARAILGILPANAQHEAGTIRFRGEDLLTMPRRRVDDQVRGRRITFIPQDPYGSFNPLFRIGVAGHGGDEMEVAARGPRMPAAACSAFSAATRGRAARPTTAAAVEMLRTVQIPRADEAFDKLPHEFSGGQRQRLMIALALMPQPDLVIADEPTTALDVTIQAQILKLLKRLAKERGVSVLFTTHDLGTAYEICDRITVMYAGQEVEMAPVDDFFQPPEPSLHGAAARKPAEAGPRTARDRRRDSRAGRSAGRMPVSSALHACDRHLPHRAARHRRASAAAHEVRCYHPVGATAAARVSATRRSCRSTRCRAIFRCATRSA